MTDDPDLPSIDASAAQQETPSQNKAYYGFDEGEGIIPQQNGNVESRFTTFDHSKQPKITETDRFDSSAGRIIDHLNTYYRAAFQQHKKTHLYARYCEIDSSMQCSLNFGTQLAESYWRTSEFVLLDALFAAFLKRPKS